MANIAYTISSSPPATIPTYDPRGGAGIAFHMDNNANRLWLGLATTGSQTWGRFATSTTRTASESAAVGTFTIAYPVVTTSSAAPTDPPQYIPTDGRIHIHVAYLPDSEYKMYIGTGESQWSIHNLVEII